MTHNERDSTRFQQQQRHLFSPPRVILAGIVHLLVMLHLCSAEEFYQRYPAYHPYCSDPKEMPTRAIPPLPEDHLRYLQGNENATSSTNSSDKGDAGNSTSNFISRLVHVTAIIRHGARTITHPKPCWDGYWEGPEGVWDCDLTTTLTTRPYSYPEAYGAENNAFYAVDKIYDAFQGDGVDSPYKNNLNGTCQAGQLIQPGYDQQQTNGQFLRDAYVYDGSSETTQQDARMHLFDTSSATPDDMPFSPQHLRLRSDDDQRTLASGQILLTKMFQPELIKFLASTGKNPVLPHHTADRPLDIMSPTYECSSSQRAEQESMASQEYRDFINAPESQTIRQMLLQEVGIAHATDELLDCLMTAMCTDRTLPKVLDDYGKEHSDDAFTKLYGPRRFERVVNYLIQNETITNRYNEAQWSKVVMAPMWAEILDHIQPVIDGANDPVKFALYSGHDSTISPLMASLSPKLWNATDFPWYASMIIIEIHEILSDNPAPDYAFRLVYNGRVLTWLVDGCPEFSHLCDVSILMERVTQFATRKNGGCGEGETRIDNQRTTSKLNNLLWSVEEADIEHPETFLIVATAISFAVGSLATCCVMKCCWSRPRRRQRNESELVLGNEETSSDFMVEEPDVVID